jgi:hypothetical protein
VGLTVNPPYYCCSTSSYVVLFFRCYRVTDIVVMHNGLIVFLVKWCQFFLKKKFEFDPIFLKFRVCGATRHQGAAAGQPRHHRSPKVRWLGHGGSPCEQQQSSLRPYTRLHWRELQVQLYKKEKTAWGGRNDISPTFSLLRLEKIIL